MANITIAIDVMGGDLGHTSTLPAVIRFLKKYSKVRLNLVGNKSLIVNYLDQSKCSLDLLNRIDITHSSQVVLMDELPQSAMRNKKDSSMRVALDLLKSSAVDAVVSAGNTGALMATARYLLRTLPNIDKPAIAKILPTVTGGQVCILDLGANLTVDANQLLQFAIMGTQLMKNNAKPYPAVGILNIGTEIMKGPAILKELSGLLKKSDLNFYGNIEGNDVFASKVDVIVTDGFVGNVALKTIEGAIFMIKELFKQEIKKNIINRFLILAVLPILLSLKKQIDPDKYNGAVMLGLNGLVIKSHGGANDRGFFYAIEQAYQEVESSFLSRLKQYLTVNPQLFSAEDVNKSEMLEFKDLSML